MARSGRVLGCVVVAIALVGCGSGTGASDGASGRGGATAAGGATGLGGGGAASAGANGSAGTNGPAGTTGSAGTSGSAGTNDSAGASGSAGQGGMAGHGTGGVGLMGCKPDVLLVQDRSGSMSNDENDNVCTRGCVLSKWSQMTTAVTNVLQATESTVNWGLKFFPDNDACDASQLPVVPIAATNATAVTAAIAATVPGGTTPTRDAISYGAMYLQTLTDNNPKFLLLATDGEPNCPLGCASMARPSSVCTLTDNPDEDLATEQAIAMAAAQGIRTFVIGIGTLATAESTLNQMAIAGGEAQSGAATSYYAATDEAAFQDALTTIVHSIAGCPH